MSYRGSVDDGLVISLFDGGWRPDDAAQMAANYEECSIDMARIICERMQELIDAGRLAVSGTSPFLYLGKS